MKEKEFVEKLEALLNDPDFGGQFKKWVKKGINACTREMTKEQIIHEINRHPNWFSIYLGVYDGTKFLVMAQVLKAWANGKDIQIDAFITCPDELERKVKK